MSAIERGECFPFDGSDEFWSSDISVPPAPSRDWIHVAARGIMADVTDRRGIKQAFQVCDWLEADRVKLVNDLCEIIMAHMADPDGVTKDIMRRLRACSGAEVEFSGIDDDVVESIHGDFYGIIMEASIDPNTNKLAIEMTPEHLQAAFALVVLGHINDTLPKEAWEGFRFHQCMVNEQMVPGVEADPDLTPEQLIKISFSSMGNEVARIIQAYNKKNVAVIGEVAGQPVYFIARAGYYMWAPQPEGGLMFDINLCFPGYPSGWR
jgi:hypothetical protein